MYIKILSNSTANPIYYHPLWNSTSTPIPQSLPSFLNPTMILKPDLHPKTEPQPPSRNPTTTLDLKPDPLTPIPKPKTRPPSWNPALTFVLKPDINLETQPRTRSRNLTPTPYPETPTIPKSHHDPKSQPPSWKMTSILVPILITTQFRNSNPTLVSILKPDHGPYPKTWPWPRPETRPRPSS